MKRRKGRRRPATVGSDCVYLAGKDICCKTGSRCSKAEFCGYEPAESSTTDKLMKIMKRKIALANRSAAAKRYA